MANDISSVVWRIDTAPFTSATMSRVKVTNLNIVDSTAADHIVITDLNNKTLVDVISNGGAYRVGPLGWVNGIKIGAGGLGASSIVEIAVGAGK